MRRVAHHDQELAPPPPFPNLPGFSHARNVLEQTLGKGTRKASTLKYLHGKPVIDDPVVPLSEDTQLHRYNLLKEQERALEQAKQLQQLRLSDSGDVHANRDQSGARPMHWTGAKTPAWLLYDKKVLRFMAYSTERVLYSPLEEVRVRRFQMSYYMEDGSLEVVEPQEPNSGLPQGVYLHRHKVKLVDGSHLSPHALRVGEELTIYGRKFVLVSCDAATRQFYRERLGQEQGPDQPMPLGKYDETRRAVDAAETAPLKAPTLPHLVGELDEPFEEQRGPGAMFEYFEDRKVQEHLDNKVLRFYCCWDDTKRVFGQKLPFALHYYLKDDTVEVVELHRRNTGRDPWPLLLSRCKLPKTPNIPTVGGRPLSPRSKKKLNIQYYHWADMRIGRVVKVYGRELLVYDMDAATRQWLTEHLDLTSQECVPIEVDFDMGPKRPPLVVPPNELGIGTEEDSMQNVLHLIPKRKTRSYTDYMENWNKVMRFSVRMVAAPGQALVGPHDAERRFILSYFLLDNTLAIYEPKVPNSGIRGGMFLERVRVRKQGTDGFLAPEDFRVGSVVTVFSRHFLLMDADCATLRFMEEECDRFPWADYDKVLSRLVSELESHPEVVTALERELSQQDKEQLGYVTREQLQAALTAVGLAVSPHEVITLVRRLGADQQGVVVEQLLGVLSPSAAPSHPVPQQQQQQHRPSPPEANRHQEGVRQADRGLEPGQPREGAGWDGAAEVAVRAAAPHAPKQPQGPVQPAAVRGHPAVVPGRAQQAWQQQGPQQSADREPQLSAADAGVRAVQPTTGRVGTVAVPAPAPWQPAAMSAAERAEAQRRAAHWHAPPSRPPTAAPRAPEEHTSGGQRLYPGAMQAHETQRAAHGGPVAVQYGERDVPGAARVPSGLVTHLPAAAQHGGARRSTADLGRPVPNLGHPYDLHAARSQSSSGASSNSAQAGTHMYTAGPRAYPEDVHPAVGPAAGQAKWYDKPQLTTGYTLPAPGVSNHFIGSAAQQARRSTGSVGSEWAHPRAAHGLQPPAHPQPGYHVQPQQQGFQGGVGPSPPQAWMQVPVNNHDDDVLWDEGQGAQGGVQQRLVHGNEAGVRPALLTGSPRQDALYSPGGLPSPSHWDEAPQHAIREPVRVQVERQVQGPVGAAGGVGAGRGPAGVAEREVVQATVVRGDSARAGQEGLQVGDTITLSKSGGLRGAGAGGLHTGQRGDGGLCVGDTISLTRTVPVTPPRDPRWEQPPYSIGYHQQQGRQGVTEGGGKQAAAGRGGVQAASHLSTYGGSTASLSSSSGGAASAVATNRSVADALRHHPQPANLWRTTNKAPGGVSHQASFRRA